MNMLGYEGNTAPDINSVIEPENAELVRQKMIKIGELK